MIGPLSAIVEACRAATAGCLGRFRTAASGTIGGEYALLATGVTIAIAVGVALIGDAAVALLTVPTDVFAGAGD